MFMSCKGQENPRYIGAEYGVFDLNKITFGEQLDTLFSKTEKYYKLPKGEEYFDQKQGSYLLKDTLYYIYRILPKFVTEGTFKFKNLDIKPKQVVDFYADHSHHFRKMELSVYISDKQYQQLLDACRDFKDVTPENVRKFNNGKYIILRSDDIHGQIQTTLYCLNNKQENNDDPGQNYFVRIAKTSLRVKTDKFYQHFKDQMQAPL